MQNVTAILNAIEEGDPQAAAQLLPLVYDELRKLAAARMADEAPGNTLNATALVHEAYLRLVGAGRRRPLGQPRPLLRGRRRSHAAHPGGRRPPEADPEARRRSSPGRSDPTCRPTPRSRTNELLALDAALTRFAAEDPVAAGLVELRHFAGLSIEDAAAALGLSRAAAYRHWTYARAWLRDAISRAESG